MSKGARTMPADGVAITFDDGPHPDITPRILDILAEAEAVATFFLVGRHAAAHPELARAIVDAGHAVGNHTQTHRNLALSSPKRTQWEIESCQESLSQVVGTAPRVFRAPWGKLTRAAVRACGQLELTPYDWTLAPEGWPRPQTARQIIEKSLATLRPGAILDLHDVPWHKDAGSRTLEALPVILHGLADRGLMTQVLPECGPLKKSAVSPRRPQRRRAPGPGS